MTSPASRSISLEGVLVLSVDDDAATLEIVRIILEDAGATVITALAAVEGLAILQRERPDVLVSDITMPGEDGFWLIAQVRALSAAHGGRTHAAALTSLTTAEDRNRILRAGFQYHVAKPIDPDQLVSVVAVLAMKE